MMDVEISQEGDTVDLIALRRRKVTRAVTEAIYRLNPGLAFLGVFLPAGIRVRLPEPNKARVVRDVPRIWS